jgi:hypothetical protein
VLVASGGVRVRGRVTFEEPAPSGTMESLRVFMPPMENEFMMMGGMEDVQVTPQGTFDIRGVLGKRRVILSGLPSGWTMKAIRIGANDVADTGYEFGKDDVTNVEIVVTNRTTSLSGTVKGDNNAPAPDYVVLAFATDQAFWHQGSRRLGTARPDQNGTYRLRNLPPGSYYVVALDSMPEEFGDPEMFERLKVDAKRATLGEGENQTLDLTLQAMPIP